MGFDEYRGTETCEGEDKTMLRQLVRVRTVKKFRSSLRRTRPYRGDERGEGGGSYSINGGEKGTGLSKIVTRMVLLTQDIPYVCLRVDTRGGLDSRRSMAKGDSRFLDALRNFYHVCDRSDRHDHKY